MTMPAPDAPSHPLLQADRLVFSHGGAPLLQGLSFTIGLGLTLVRGGDGRGKSTLLRLIAGSLQPAGGTLCRHAATLSFENPSDPAHDQAVAGAWLQARLAPFPHALPPDEVRRLVDGFGLAEHIDKPLYMLSTGSRRKVGLVAAAASQAALTLLDTPFAALDGPSRERLARLLAEEAAGTSRAWIIADYEWPPGLAGVRCAGIVDLGD
ncbi:ATP-binding cassette domain-containing protein [Aquincola sp. MAHUQ-54]|uniref:ATP-binding cassette domain-containing protein n=1 Tax=Aquincola agrisoli TaxID=3119538 RepID=A0AAW9QB78_9BURK